LTSKANECVEKTQNKGYLRRSRSPQNWRLKSSPGFQEKIEGWHPQLPPRVSPTLVTPLVNSNWHPISYRVGVIEAYCSNFGHCVFDNVRCSSWAHWKAHSGLPISAVL